MESKTYLCHVKDKIGNCGQCSTSYVNVCIYLQLLKTNLNLRKFQIYSTSSEDIEEIKKRKTKE